MTDRPVLELFLGDVVRLKRRHPCGGDEWLVDRVGADIGLRCSTCGRHVLLDRRPLERRFGGFVRRGDPALTAAAAPGRPSAAAGAAPGAASATGDAATPPAGAGRET